MLGHLYGNITTHHQTSGFLGTKDTAGAVDTALVTGGTVGLPRDDISQFMHGTGRSG